MSFSIILYSSCESSESNSQLILITYETIIDLKNLCPILFYRKLLSIWNCYQRGLEITIHAFFFTSQI